MLARSVSLLRGGHGVTLLPLGPGVARNGAGLRGRAELASTDTTESEAAS